jgi:opacity protein-like surface antigen
MYQKCIKLFLLLLLVGASTPVFSQVAPQATERGVPLSIGIGYSNYDTDWSGRMSGTALWADWSFYNAPSLLNGFGLEAEGRFLNYGRTGGDPKLAFYTGAGGAIYTARRYRSFQPYAKFLIGFGGVYFSPLEPQLPYYTHDTRTFYAPGGGLDFRVYRALWVRGDYEYQFWTDFFAHNALNPSGFTIGAVYDFHRR